MLPKIDTFGTPQFISLESEKTFSSVTKSFLFGRYDWNHWMADSLKPIHSIFSKSRCDSTCWMLFVMSNRIIPVWNILSISLKTKFVSCTMQESVEKFAQKPDSLTDTYKVSHFYPNNFVSQYEWFPVLS